MNNSPSPARLISHWQLWLLSVLTGVVAGLGAVVFRGLIGLFHNLFFLGRFSLEYNANLHTASAPWGPWVILAPVIGAAGVAFLVTRFAPEAKGHGVPEVMDAIYYRKGVIRPVVAVIKAIASALSIGSGGSVGREGPIVQIASSFGSSLGQWLRLPAGERITMIAAGAGGGIAATFNTPIGGVLFAVELLLHEVSVWTLVPVLISTATATYVGRLFLGVKPSFSIPDFGLHFFHPTNPEVLPAYLALGILIGVVSALFIKSIYAFEDFFETKIPGNYYSRHLLGMALVGVIIYLLQRCLGHYYVEGVGYSTIQDILTAALSSIPVLLLLFVLKIVATALTLGSGGSGGIFSPSLFVGAAFGGAYGWALKLLFPALQVSPSAFAVAGMAGLVGSATGAAATAIVMIFEMTLDYQVILPMTVTVAISYGVRKLLSKESIYSMKLARRGQYLPESLQSNFVLVRLARDLMDRNFAVLPASAPLLEQKDAADNGEIVPKIILGEDGSILGTLTVTPAMRRLALRDGAPSLRELVDPNFELIPETATVFEILSQTHLNRPTTYLVTSSNGAGRATDIKGVITKERLIDAIADNIQSLKQ